MKQTLLSHEGPQTSLKRLLTMLVLLALQQFAYAQVSVSIVSTTDVSCFGASDGAVDINVSGGTPPYSYSWSNGSLTEDLSGISAGSYSVTVTDALMNSASIGATIAQPSKLTATKFVKDVSCNGGSNGSFSVSPAGGTAPYSYQWSTGDTTSGINNLVSGIYSVSITDNNSCSLIVTDTIGEPSEFMVLNPTGTPVSCHGGSDGTASLMVVGGILPYTFNWSNGAVTKDLTGIPAGTYNVTASDNNGCKDYATVIITEPAQAISATVSVTNSTCYYSTDGSIDVSVSGGTPPYTYLWNTSDTSEDLLNVSAGTYSLTITDANSCTFNLNPEVFAVDTIPPVAQCRNINLYLDASGNASIAATQIDNGSSDNCSIDTLVLDKYNFNCAEIGNNTVRFIAYDSNGNSDTCFATVNVIDTVAPALVLQDITVYLDASGVAAITTADIDNGTTDACGIDSLFLDRYSFSCADIGVQTLIFTAVDVNSNQASATANVTVLDSIAPVAVTQNLSIYLDASGQASITAVQVDNGSSDICGIDTLVLDKYTFGCADLGVQTVNLTATDAGGNNDVASALITVMDTVSPALSVQNINAYLDHTGSVSIAASDLVLSANDACGMDTILLDIYNFSCAEVGPNTVQITATDVNANQSLAAVVVTVIDTITPDVKATDINLYLDASGQASITVADIDNGSSAVCGMDSLYLDKYDFTCADVGVNKVALIGLSLNGVIGTDTALVTVIDNTQPVAATKNVTLYLDANGQASVTAVDIDNGTTDECGMDTLVLNHYDFTCAHTGLNPVMLIAMDNNGNTSFEPATVTVVDTLSPVLTAKDISIYLDENGQASITAADVVASAIDNCVIDTLLLDTYNFGCADTGANVVHITAYDLAGNTDFATANVMVLDTINPEVMAQDITVYLDIYGQVSFGASDVDAGSGTACGMDTLLLSKYSCNCSDLGPNAVILTAIKPNGNQTSDSTTVTVLDTVAPTLNPANIDVYLDANGEANISVSDIDPNISDACGLDSASLDITYLTCASVGANSIELKAWDLSGNMASATATVTVWDTLAPEFTTNDTTIYLNAAGQASITADYVSSNATDICGMDTVVLDIYNFTCAQAGINLVSVSAIDVNGNTTTSQVSVIVIDSIDPVLATTDIDLYLDANGQASIGAGQLVASATDACSIDTLVLDTYTFDCSNTGANTVTVTAIDPFGNSTSATATISVFDTIAPAAASQNVDIYLDTSGHVSITALDVNLYLHEACGLDTLYFSRETFSCADLGTKRIAFTAIDVSGNRVDDSLTVSVRDTTPPRLVNQNLTVYLDANGQASITAGDVNQLSTDVCGIDTIYLDRYNFSCADLGPNTVTLYAKDLNGTLGSAPATVTVEDTVQPVVKARNLTVYSDATGIARISIADVDNGSYDANCSYSLSISDSIFDCGELGLNLEQLTITDGGGNSQTVDFFVTVLDTLSPQLVLKDITVSLNSKGKAVITADQLDSASTDNCTQMLAFTASQTQFDCSHIGVNPISVTATDGKLNTATGMVNVTVLDAAPPVALARDISIYLDASGTATAGAGDVNNGSTDNCGLDSLWLSQSSFSGADLGQKSVLLYAKDLAGNISAATSIITVRDTTSPAISSQNFTLYLDASGQAVFNAMAHAVATDNHMVTSMNVSRSGFSCADLGVNSISVTAVDASGNSTSAPVSITVMDSLPPVVKTKNISLYLDAQGTASLAAADVNANSSDNCGIQGMSLSQSVFGCSDLGHNVVVLSMTDASGNTSGENLVVNVLDTIRPVLSNLPGNITVAADASSCGAAVNFAMPVVNDNCSSTSISSSHMPGAFFPTGQNLVSFSVQDAAGNTAMASFSITVVDQTAPVITSMPASDTIGSCQAFYSFAMPTATDNCSPAMVAQTAGIPSGGYYPVGTTTNSFRIADANGNDTVVSFDVVVMPAGKPQLPTIMALCVNDDPVDFSQGQNMNWAGKGMQGPGIFDPAQAGAGHHQLNYDFMDAYGCITAGSIAITVNPTPVVPVISRIGATTLGTGAYDAYQWYRDGVAIAGATSQSFSYTEGGNYQVMVSNIASCSSHSEGYVVGQGSGGIGVEENLLYRLNIYPNPAQGNITIDLNSLSRKEMEVTLYNITGKVVLHEKGFTETDGKLRLDLARLPRATYILHISSASEVVVRQVVLY